ncbi:MAG: hypothetical protein HOQ18_04060 [Dermatophilaceae bacterium]|nr:hypothetical protein [Dermatophilaceae bacterium]NUR79410.1 hypothetical protein [Dermatophilaceae bacterium]
MYADNLPTWRGTPATSLPGDPDGPVLCSALALLELYDEHRERLPRRNQFSPGWDLVSAAAAVARTHAAPLPRL